jgi:hypothetical protein
MTKRRDRALPRQDHAAGRSTKTFRIRIVGWALAAVACLVGVAVLGGYLPGSLLGSGEGQGERYQRENKRVRDSVQKAGEICSRDFPGRIDLYAECLEKLTREIPPARY